MIGIVTDEPPQQSLCDALPEQYNLGNKTVAQHIQTEQLHNILRTWCMPSADALAQSTCDSVSIQQTGTTYVIDLQTGPHHLLILRHC